MRSAHFAYIDFNSQLYLNLNTSTPPEYEHNRS